MFNDDMILETKEPGTVRQDGFARHFVTLVLAVVGGTLADAVFIRLAMIENPELAVRLSYGIRSGVFAAILMAQPITAIMQKRKPMQVLAYFLGGFLLGISLQFFLLTPNLGPRSMILAYFIISVIVMLVWGVGRGTERISAWFGLPQPVDAGRAILGFFQRFLSRKGPDPLDPSDLDDLDDY